MSAPVLTAPAQEAAQQPPVGAARASQVPGRNRPPRRRSRATSVAGLVDCLVVLVLGATVMAGLRPVFGDWSIARPVLVGLVAGVLVAWLGAVLRLPAVVVAAGTVVAYGLVGGVATASTTLAAGVLPTMATVRELAGGAVGVWKESLTAPPPLGAFTEYSLVPFAASLLLGVLAASAALRSRRPWVALLPVAGALVGVILWGTRVAFAPVTIGVVLAAVSLLWVAWRSQSAALTASWPAGTPTADGQQADAARQVSAGAAARVLRARLASAAVVLLVAGCAAALLTPSVVDGEDRTSLREDVVPPLDLREYVSPLAQFRLFTKDEADTELFSVAGLPGGARIRLATLETYDGQVFGAAGSDGEFTRVGGVLAGQAASDDVPVEVKIAGYRGVWVPSAGKLVGIGFDAEASDRLAESTYASRSTGTTLTTGGLRDGDTVDLTVSDVASVAEDTITAATVTQASVPDLVGVPDVVAATATRFIGQESDALARVRAIRDGLVANGVYSSGLDEQRPSRPGHSADRIATLLGHSPMVGDEEQFAAAMAMMLRAAGIPSRVVVGAYPEGGTVQGVPFTVTGADVHAWVEVPFDGYGWVAFDVRPEENNQVEPEPQSNQVPKPPVLQEPQPPQEPPADEPGKVVDESKDDSTDTGTDVGAIALVVAAVALPLLVLLGPVLLVLGYKARRRRRRQSAALAADRTSGGWYEILDAATDLGVPVPVSATRREGAAVINASLPGVDLAAVAVAADDLVFAAADPDDGRVRELWVSVAAAVRSMRHAVPWWRRVTSRLSLGSITIARQRAQRAVARGGTPRGAAPYGATPRSTTTRSSTPRRSTPRSTTARRKATR